MIHLHVSNARHIAISTHTQKNTNAMLSSHPLNANIKIDTHRPTNPSSFPSPQPPSP